MRLILSYIVLYLLPLALSAQDRVEIPGSRMTIIPPLGVEPNDHFAIITKRNFFEMTLIEHTGDVDPILRELDSAAWASKGVQVYSQFEFNIGEYNALCIHKKLNSKMDALTLTFGDSVFLVQIQTNFLTSHKGLHDEILKAYNSIQFDASKKTNWDKVFAFDYDHHNAFQLQTEYISPLLFTFLKEKVEVLDSTTSFIGIRQYPNGGNYENLETFMARSISSSIIPEFDLKEIIFDGPVDHNGAQAYRIDAITQKSDLSEHLTTFLGYLTEDYGILVFANLSNENDKGDITDFLKGVQFK